MKGQVETVEEKIEGVPNVENLLADLDSMGDVEEPEITELAPAGDVTEEALADLDITLQQQEAYAAQESTITVNEKIEAPAGEVKPKKSGSTGSTRTTSSTPAAPRPSRELSSVADSAFALSTDADLTDADANKAAKDAMIAARPAQVKIAEKFDQLFACLAAGKPASTYVMAALTALDAKAGAAMTSADLIAHYKAAGLGDGTARSQTGQIMELFRITGVATRTGQSLVANDKSLVAKRLREIAAPKATA